MDGHALGSGAGMTVVRHIEHPGATATALPKGFNVLTEAPKFFQKRESCLGSVWDQFRDPLTFHTQNSALSTAQSSTTVRKVGLFQSLPSPHYQSYPSKVQIHQTISQTISRHVCFSFLLNGPSRNKTHLETSVPEPSLANSMSSSTQPRASLLGSDQPGRWSRDQPRGLRAVIAAHGAASPQLFGNPWLLQAPPWLAMKTKQRSGKRWLRWLSGAKPFAPCPWCQPSADISNLPRQPSLPIRSPSIPRCCWMWSSPTPLLIRFAALPVFLILPKVAFTRRCSHTPQPGQKYQKSPTMACFVQSL